MYRSHLTPNLQLQSTRSQPNSRKATPHMNGLSCSWYVFPLSNILIYHERQPYFLDRQMPKSGKHPGNFTLRLLPPNANGPSNPTKRVTSLGQLSRPCCPWHRSDCFGTTSL